MLKIIRSNEKDFFDNFEILNSEIKEIDEKRKDNIFLSLFFLFDFDILNSKIEKIYEIKRNNLLSLLSKKEVFLISKRNVLKDREIISLF